MGNPASPAILQRGVLVPDTVWCQPRSSVVGDWVMNHALKGPGLRRVELSGTAAVGAITWSIAERFDLSVQLGSGRSHLQWLQGGQQLQARPQGGLLWAGEAKLVLLEMEDTALSAFGQAGGWDWSEGTLARNDVPLAGHADLQMRFWQVGAAVSQSIGRFSPYIGVAVLRARYKLENATLGIEYLEQKSPVGPVFGCTLSNAASFALNLECRAVFENGVSLSGEIRF